MITVMKKVQIQNVCSDQGLDGLHYKEMSLRAHKPTKWGVRSAKVQISLGIWTV